MIETTDREDSQMALVFQQLPRRITQLMNEPMPELRPMTIRDLMDQLEAIPDKSTPVYLESGEPVHYTSHGMNQNETRFFIGVM